LSGCVLPTPGEKTVAAEAYDKLSESQKQLVVEKVNRKTKKVIYFKPILCQSNSSFFFFLIKVARESAKEQIFEVGHTALVKAKLVALLTSEVVAVVNMHHVAISVSSDINDEGLYITS
jgi:hypothetical protein